MNNVINAVESAHKPIFIANISKEPAKPWVRAAECFLEFCSHFGLLEFVAGENRHAAWIVMRENLFDKGLAK
jgi:hypothetical protein